MSNLKERFYRLMIQKEYVKLALKQSGGFATLNQLYTLTNTSNWGTKTPFASIRRILQTNDDFFKIVPGLWGLKDASQEIKQKLHFDSKDSTFNHTYYQGLIASIGKIRGFSTFIPSQDRNKVFLHTNLGAVASLERIYPFSYDSIVQKAKYSDCIWFNERKMPYAFYEVEHSTNIKNSINRFYELQDFRAKFFIVADKRRLNEFNKIISESIYNPIREFVKFADYESVAKQYEKESQKYEMGI